MKNTAVFRWRRARQVGKKGKERKKRKKRKKRKEQKRAFLHCFLRVFQRANSGRKTVFSGGEIFHENLFVILPLLTKSGEGDMLYCARNRNKGCRLADRPTERITF